MKRLILALSILSFASIVKAEMAKDVLQFSHIGTEVTEAIGYSSTTCAPTLTAASTIISTVGASELYNIVITSAGSTDSFFAVFDGSGAIVGSAPASTGTARAIDLYVSANTVRTIPYYSNTRNGILVYANGAVPPCLGIRYNSR